MLFYIRSCDSTCSTAAKSRQASPNRRWYALIAVHALPRHANAGTKSRGLCSVHSAGATERVPILALNKAAPHSRPCALDAAVAHAIAGMCYISNAANPVVHKGHLRLRCGAASGCRRHSEVPHNLTQRGADNCCQVGLLSIWHRVIWEQVNMAPPCRFGMHAQADEGE